MQSKIEVPEYDGSQCTSACGNDYDCPHGEVFDEGNGIIRSGLDFDIEHDNTETHFVAELAPAVEELIDLQAEVEAKWGEERVSTNE